jgi:hypothetical protein
LITKQRNLSNSNDKIIKDADIEIIINIKHVKMNLCYNSDELVTPLFEKE